MSFKVCDQSCICDHFAVYIKNFSSCINVQPWAWKFLQGDFLHLLLRYPPKKRATINHRNAISIFTLLLKIKKTLQKQQNRADLQDSQNSVFSWIVANNKKNFASRKEKSSI